MAGKRSPDRPGSDDPPERPRHRPLGARLLRRFDRGWTLGLLAVGALVLVLVGLTLNYVLPGPGRDSGAAGGSTASAAGLAASGPAAQPSSPAASASPSASRSGRPSASPSRSGSRAAAPPGVTIVDPHRPNCAPKPSACGLPDATNTGVPAGTSLTVVNGDVYVTTAGTVIDAKDIRGCVIIEAANVTIRRSKISCPNYYTIANLRENYRGGSVLIEDSEVDCRNTSGNGLGYYGITARRLNIHSCENGFDVNDTVTVEDSYIHDLYESSTSHTDGLQLPGGAHITINHNTIFVPGATSAIISDPTADSDVVISNNLLAGGAYTLYCPRDSSQNYQVVGNRFSTLFSPKSGEFGPWLDCEKVAVLKANVWDNNLQPVT